MRVYLVAQAWFELLCKEYEKMRLYLAGEVESLNSDMKLFLAESGGLWEAYFPAEHFAHAYILQSFYYADEFTEKVIIPNAKDFLFDSGAFTFCGTGAAVDFDDFLKRYAAFIVRNNITKFFELDVDSITGYEKVLDFRKRLEDLTGRQPIPVWHIDRGKEEFIRHCEEYPYVALGGYVAAIKASDPRQKAYVRAYPWFIKTAHEKGAKIHGLGFTSLKGLEQYHFDSVDSTAWTTGNRFGYVYHFNGKTMTKTDVPKGHRLADAKRVALHNFCEWKNSKTTQINICNLPETGSEEI